MYYSESDESRPSTSTSGWGLPGSFQDDDNLAGMSVRQQKMLRQRTLMQQKQREKRLQTGMVMASDGPAARPSSRSGSRLSRPTSSRSGACGLVDEFDAFGPRPDAPQLNNDKLAKHSSDRGTFDGSLTYSNSLTERPIRQAFQRDTAKRPSHTATVIQKKLEQRGMAGSLDFVEPQDEPEIPEITLSEQETEETDGRPPSSSRIGKGSPARRDSASSSELATGGPLTTTGHGMKQLKESIADGRSVRKTSNALPCSPGYDMDELDDFIMRPAPHSQTIQCRLTRDTRGIDKMKYPCYYLHLERDDGKKVLLLAARRRKKSKTSNYIISRDSTDLARDGDSFVGKLRANFVGTQFTVYDDGANPSKGEVLADGSNIREELAATLYDTNVFGIKGPRKMTVILPAMGPDQTRIRVKPQRTQDTLLERYKQHDMKNLLCLHNKTPQWNDETQSYVLNFHGRVTKASVKNFQIIHYDDPDYIVMQFGRVSEDVFSMDYNYPLCALQAFAITLSSFDNKLACE